MTRLILVRHGETDWNKSRLVQGGNSDIPLDDVGREQARLLASRLKQEKIEAIYSSPLQRALDTAHEIARYHNLEVKPEPALKELNIGTLDGIPITLVRQRLDEMLLANGRPKIQPEPSGDLWRAIQYAGGELLPDLQQRVEKAIRNIVSQHPDGTVLVVSHHFAILTIISTVLNLPVDQIGRLYLDNASISIVSFSGAVNRLLLFNETCHLTERA